MAHIDPTLITAPVAGIADPHQSTVAGILRAVEQGLFTVAEAGILIDRLRAHVTTVPVAVPVGSPLSSDDGLPVTVSGHASDTLLDGPDRTF